MTGVDSASPATGVTVEGANITGNVYGGGNEAEVTGYTEVQIGREAVESTGSAPATTSEEVNAEP